MKQIVSFILSILLLSAIETFGQSPTLIENTGTLKINLDSVFVSHEKKILELVDRIESSTKLAIKTLENDKTFDPQVKIILDGILSQTVDFKTKFSLFHDDIEAEKEAQFDIVKTEVEKLLNELERRNGVIAELNYQQSEKIAQAILDYIQDVKKLSSELEKKKNEIVQLNNTIKEKNDKIRKINTAYTKLEELKDSLEVELKIKTTELKYLTGGPFKIGMSAGLNYQFSGNTEYIIQSDSTARVLDGKGWQGLISAVILFHPDSLFGKPNKIDFILNVPVAEIGFGDNQNISTIFNKPIALGLGLGYQLDSHFSIFSIINVSSNQIIDDKTLEQRKFSEEEFTILDKTKYATTTQATFSLSVGFLYKFGNGNK